MRSGQFGFKYRIENLSQTKWEVDDWVCDLNLIVTKIEIKLISNCQNKNGKRAGSTPDVES